MNKIQDNHEIENDESDGFYSRWSKRKIQAQNNLTAENQPAESTLSNRSSDASGLLEAEQGTVVLRDEDMPDLATLDEDSDYSGFLSPGVSEQLRKLALRKLFQGKSFNLCDGLDDYDEEFTSFEKLGDIVTADMRFQLEQEARRKLQIASENDQITEDLTEEIAEECDEVIELNEEYTDTTSDKPIPEAVIDETADNNINDENTNNREGKTLPENENLS